MAICCAYSGDHSAMAFIANKRHQSPSIAPAGRPLVFRRVSMYWLTELVSQTVSFVAVPPRNVLSYGHISHAAVTPAGTL
jgi:hypothetical protein